MHAYVFPGQGAQFVGMGKSLYDENPLAKDLFEQANGILGFRITDLMFAGTDDDLKQTKVTQPAVFLHSVVLALPQGDAFRPDMPAIIGLADEQAEQICAEITDEVVVCANYNCPGQIVISGTLAGVDAACEKMKAAGAKRALKLKVGGAFHSPLMEPARTELAEAIESTHFNQPVCPVYQNVDARPQTDPDAIRRNLIAQLTSPVRWTQTVRNMASDGATHFTELGPGNVLQGLIKKIEPAVAVDGLQ